MNARNSRSHHCRFVWFCVKHREAASRSIRKLRHTIVLRSPCSHFHCGLDAAVNILFLTGGALKRQHRCMHNLSSASAVQWCNVHETDRQKVKLNFHSFCVYHVLALLAAYSVSADFIVLTPSVLVNVRFVMWMRMRMQIHFWTDVTASLLTFHAAGIRRREWK